MLSLKASSAVLLRPDGETLEAFGNEAEDKYAELQENNGHEFYYYFTDMLVKLKKYYEEKGVSNKHVFFILFSYYTDTAYKRT